MVQVVRLVPLQMPLVPLAPVVKPKTLGLLQGKVGIAADFDAPLPADFLLSRNTV